MSQINNVVNRWFGVCSVVYIYLQFDEKFRTFYSPATEIAHSFFIHLRLSHLVCYHIQTK